MEKIELKPCPFCGGTEIEMEANAYMRCTSCGASSGWKYDPVEAIEAWNTRATENKSENIDDIMQNRWKSTQIKDFRYTGVNPPEWLEAGK